MKIRNFTLDDLTEASALLMEMWLLHADKGGKLLNRSYIENYDIGRYLTKAFGDSQQLLLVAEEDGAIVGIARAELKEHNDMHSFKKSVYLDDLAVHPDYQRRGIADALTERQLEWAKERGAQAAKAKVYSFNDKSQGLMQKHGFEDVYSYYYKFF